VFNKVTESVKAAQSPLFLGLETIVVSDAMQQVMRLGCQGFETTLAIEQRPAQHCVYGNGLRMEPGMS